MKELFRPRWLRWLRGLALVGLFAGVGSMYWTQGWPAPDPNTPRHSVHASSTAHLDGIYYYAYLRSLMVDGDLDFANDYAKLGNPLHAHTVEATGRVENPFTIGPALSGRRSSGSRAASPS